MSTIVNHLSTKSLPTYQGDEKRLRNELTRMFLESTDINPTSRAYYGRVLAIFHAYLDQTGQRLGSLTIGSLIAYKQHLIKTKRKAPTICGYLSVLRRFFKWTEANRIFPNISQGLKLPRMEAKFRKLPLDVDKAKELIDQMTNQRDKALVTLLLRTGLRTCEVTRANLGDFEHRGTKLVLNVQGKGRTEADNFVVITPRTWQTISDYLVARGPLSPTSPLFVSKSNRTKEARLTTRSVRGIVKTGLRAIGLNDSKFSAHSLRHTAGTLCLETTGDLERTRVLLRHKTQAPTLIYTHTIQEKLRLQNPGEEILDTLY